MGNGFRKRRASRWMFLWACILAVAAPPAGAHAHSETAPAARAVNPAGGFGGPFTLVDHNGMTVKDGDFRGKVMIVYFGYTHCPDICPVDAQNIGNALDLLGDRASSVRALFITVDPGRDGPARLAKWLGAIYPGFVGLTGTADQIAAVAKAYKVVFNRVERAGGYDYTFNHPGLTYVMGVDGRFLFLIPPGAGSDAIAREVRAVLPAER